MKKVAVVILNWNGEKLLREFLPSVVERTNRDLGEVVVADNHSEDGSLVMLEQEFPEVKLIRFHENYGFAGGYNRALRLIEAEYVVLLNSDVEVGEGWLEPLVALLDKEKEVGAVQPKIKAWKEKEKFEYAGACGGFMDRYGFPFCRGRILNRTEADQGQYEDVAEVFWCSGAALCVRREVYEACGGLDERFFAHMEEIDLCWRMRNAGYKMKVQPASVVYHLGGGSLPMKHPKKLFLNYRNNLLMLYKNLADKERKKVLRVRGLLDICAWGIFVIKGEWKNACSVMKAYKAYKQMRKEYPETASGSWGEGVYPGSIIYACYIRRIRTFSALCRRWQRQK